MGSSRLFWRAFLAHGALLLAAVSIFALLEARWESPPSAEIGANQRVVLWAGVAALGVGLTWLIVRRTIGPLQRLIDAAETVAADDEERSAPLAGRDQFDALGAALSHMQRKLNLRVEELRSSSERLYTVLSSMAEGVIAVDPQERLLLANEAGRRQLAFVTSDAVGRPLLEVTRSRVVHEAVREALAGGEPVRREFEAPGGARRILSLRAVNLPGDPCPGVMVVLHDISELRRLENLRREFVANVSHELKTPLASIKAYSETLKLGAVDDPEYRDLFLGRIEEQADRLHQLIIDLLHLARVESGQEAFEIGEVSLGDLIADCVAQFDDAAAAKRIALSTEPPDYAVVARGDEEGVRTIINNLIDNAIKYTPHEGRVTVAWRAEGDRAVLEVSDTGIGIAGEMKDRVFERFYRVDKARSREMGGTGLGLSIVKHLAQAFGGEVSLESEVGRGSTFRVTLPTA